MKKQILSLALVFTAVAVLFSACKKDDTGAPTVSITGDGIITLGLGETWTDPGATANDAEDGVITEDIVVTGTVNTDKVGEYTVTYKVADKAGNEGTATRTVKVKADAMIGSYNVIETYPDNTTSNYVQQVVISSTGYNVLVLNAYGNYGSQANVVATFTGTGFTGAELNYTDGTDLMKIYDISGTYAKVGNNYNITTSTYKVKVGTDAAVTMTQAYTRQ